MKKTTIVTLGCLVIGFIILLLTSITYIYENSMPIKANAKMLQSSTFVASSQLFLKAGERIVDRNIESVKKNITIEDMNRLLSLVNENAGMIAERAAVTVIGDSIVLGAQDTLSRTVPNIMIDAKVSRSVIEGYHIFMSLQNNGELKEYVVITLGTNGTYQYKSLLTNFIDNLEPGHKLIIVTPFDGRSNENADILKEMAEWERSLPDTYNFITIADWNAKISSQAHLLAGDKVHMGDLESVNIYVDCLVNAIYQASLKPSK